jgi:hypothetical protein
LSSVYLESVSDGVARRCLLAKCDKKPKQPLNRKLPEIPPQHFRHVGLFDAEQIGGLPVSPMMK